MEEILDYLDEEPMEIFNQEGVAVEPIFPLQQTTITPTQHSNIPLNCLKAMDAPIIISDYVFPAFPAYSSENVLHKINLTSVMCETKEFLKSRLFSTFKRFGSVKDTVIYHDDINYAFETLTYRISLTGTDTFLLATWDRMPDYCRYCKVVDHTEGSCDKRPADLRTCFICHKKEHASYQCTRAHDRSLQPHKRPRQREPDSTITRRRMATPSTNKSYRSPGSSFNPSFDPSVVASTIGVASLITNPHSLILALKGRNHINFNN
ncbi:hypothetical protein G6F37_007878 [Rhizopus arrhizus]|nr:hypothetical protein G6F38_011898 [Rhizopus arrhizus]KAG1156150.1 hypothetical protein G6F37_007878 [Rhizopus arrhizus]